MLTFSDIYEAMRKEKYSENLQMLPKKFLMEVSEYFKEKKEFLNKEDDLFSDISIKNKKRLDNAVSSFRDLLRIRKKKILNLAFVASQVGISKKDFENLMAFEKDLFEELVKALERAEKNQVSDMSGSVNDERKHRLVRFLEDVPAFLGFDGIDIGPFVKEVVNIYDKKYNPFRSWKNDRILYPFCYYPHREEIKNYLREFASKLRKKLNITDKTKQHEVTFDGAQNQGYNHCWVAIYDERFKSQEETKQIYIGFHKDKITFDIYEHESGKWGDNFEDARGEMSYDDFNFKTLIDFFEDKKEDIFELRHLEKDLDGTLKEFQKNKKFTKKEKDIIDRKMYLEESKFDSVFQVVKRTNHHCQLPRTKVRSVTNPNACSANSRYNTVPSPS